MIRRSVSYPLRLKDDLIQGSVTRRVAAEFVPEFDEHLAALSNLFHQYQKHAWVSEHDAPDYSRLADTHCAEVLSQLDAIGRATVRFGGVPLGSPLEHVNRSYLEHEDEGVYPLAAMLERSLRFEDVVALRLSITVEAAENIGADQVQGVLQPLLVGAKGRRERLQRFSEELR